MSHDVPSSFNFLFLSTPVGPLGSGMGGGVELTLQNVAIALSRQNHHITIVAPQGSFIPVKYLSHNLSIVEIPGTLQKTAQHQGREAPAALPDDSVLANMWDYARSVQHEHHVLVNFAYDWLPFYLTAWLERSVAHLISMGSLTDAMDSIIQTINTRFPGTLAVHSHTQAATFANSDRWPCLDNGLDLSLYQFQPTPDESLAWVGRISPEKGLEDAIAAVEPLSLTLEIFGTIENMDYWQHVQTTYSNANIRYRGFLPTHDLQAALGTCKGLVMTPKWVEAFGNVAIEAMACGVPVVAYRRGGPSEIIRHGITGWLVDPDNVEELRRAIALLNSLDRSACRHHVETKYSLDAMGDRVLAWLTDIWQTYSAVRVG
ncbi:MAG: glycosyltransferase [Leptolyngbyaceae bacterium]|nr:glycosyltransferase [Leptolyngbyaceae bacterium]